VTATAAGDADAALADRVARGDAGAEAVLCARFAPRVRLFGLHHLRAPAAAEDLVQAVLLQVLVALREGRLKEGGQLGAFVLATCRQVVADTRRTERRREGLLARFGEALVPDAPQAPGEAAEAGDLERLRGCVERLAERARTVVALSVYAGKSGAEVAAELGLSPGNVRVLRHRALAQLQACMGLEEASA
jgi:RNA polymerase sigma-70 factor (ECF subfamily)